MGFVRTRVLSLPVLSLRTTSDRGRRLVVKKTNPTRAQRLLFSPTRPFLGRHWEAYPLQPALVENNINPRGSSRTSSKGMTGLDPPKPPGPRSSHGLKGLPQSAKEGHGHFGKRLLLSQVPPQEPELLLGIALDRLASML